MTKKKDNIIDLNAVRESKPRLVCHACGVVIAKGRVYTEVNTPSGAKPVHISCISAGGK